MVTTVIIVMIVMIMIDAKNAINVPRMIGRGIAITSGRKKKLAKDKKKSF